MNAKHQPGFTLVETAIVLIVAGLIIATLMPVILKSLRREQTARAKTVLRDARDEIIGYAIAHGHLPRDLSGIAHNRDAFDNPFIYAVAQELNQDQSPCQTNSTTLVLRRYASQNDYTDYADVAFVLISAGENRNVQTGHEQTRVTTFPFGLSVDYDASDGSTAEPYDDMSEFATLLYLKGRLCTASGTSSTSAPAGSDISFQAGINSFNQISQPSGSNVIVVDQNQKEIGMGNGSPDTWGCVWYGGDGGGWCSDGACSATDGMRAFFRFRFANKDTSSDSRDYSSGFTFAAVAWTGGDPPCGGGGDCLGYSGIPGPKMGVEFDVYPNQSRNDYSNSNHIAALFWGSQTENNQGTTHGAGTSAVHNAAYGETGYYQNPGAVTWMEDLLEHTARIEIERNASDPTRPTYKIKTWIDCVGSDDLTTVYNASHPLITHAATFSASEAQALSRLRLGWTYGSGTNPQSVTIDNFGLKFIAK